MGVSISLRFQLFVELAVLLTILLVEWRLLVLAVALDSTFVFFPNIGSGLGVQKIKTPEIKYMTVAMIEKTLPSPTVQGT
jgi:hypothetical protein